MDSAAVGVLVKTDQVGLGGLLQSQNGLGLEAEILLVLVGDLADKALERSLADQEVRGLLVPRTM